MSGDDSKLKKCTHKKQGIQSLRSVLDMSSILSSKSLIRTDLPLLMSGSSIRMEFTKEILNIIIIVPKKKGESYG